MHTSHHIASIPEISPLRSVSTESVKTSERLEFWQANAAFLFGALQLEMEKRGAFDASLEYTDIADLIFCRLSTSVPHRVVRTPAFAHRDDRGLVKGSHPEGRAHYSGARRAIDFVAARGMEHLRHLDVVQHGDSASCKDVSFDDASRSDSRAAFQSGKSRRTAFFRAAWPRRSSFSI